MRDGHKQKDLKDIGFEDKKKGQMWERMGFRIKMISENKKKLVEIPWLPSPAFKDRFSTPQNLLLHC